MDKEKKVELQKLNPVNEAKPIDEAELDEAELDKVTGGTDNALNAIAEALKALARKQ